MLLTCFKNEIFVFLLDTLPAPPSQRNGDPHNLSLFKKDKKEPLGFSESTSSLEKEMSFIEIVIVEVTKNFSFYALGI